METKKNYRMILKEKEYMKLIVANCINRFGDSIDSIAFSYMAYEITGSPVWLAIIFGVSGIPSALFQPLAGVFVENFHKKHVMMLTDIGRGVLVCLTAFLYVNQILTPLMLVIITFFMSTLEAFGMPAGIAFTPKILAKEKYAYGMALSSTLSRVFMMIGLVTAGGIIGLFGSGVAMFIDALSFVLSGLIILCIKCKEDLQKIAWNFTNYFTNLKEGFQVLQENRPIYYLCMLTVLINAVFIPLSVVQTPYVVDILKKDASMISLMSIFMLLGMAVGSAVYPKIQERITNHQLLTVSGIGVCVGFISLFGIIYIQNDAMIYVACCIAYFIIGLCNGFISILVNVSFMNHVSEKFIARVGAIFNAFSGASAPILSMLTSVLFLILSIPNVILACGIVGILIFLYLGTVKGLEKL